MNRWVYGALLCFSLVLTGCLKTRSYVGDALADVAFTDIAVPEKPRPVVATVQFKRNGQLNENVAVAITPIVLDVLKTSRAFSVVETTGGDGADRIEFVLHNLGDIGGSAAKGVITGLTFGLIGTKTTDKYEFLATFTPTGKPSVQKHYEHAMYTTVGLASVKGLTPVTTEAAVNEVIRDFVLSALRDFQREGFIPAAR